jgi:hypothetical protein
MLLKGEKTMEMFGRKMEKKKIYRLEDEREFFFLIEQRLKEGGYQLLDTLKRVTSSGPVDYSHFS